MSYLLYPCPPVGLVVTQFITFKGVQPFGISGPHWKKSCLEPPVKYTATHNCRKKKSHKVVSEFTVLCWVTFIVILGGTRPARWGWTPLIPHCPLLWLEKLSALLWKLGCFTLGIFGEHLALVVLSHHPGLKGPLI